MNAGKLQALIAITLILMGLNYFLAVALDYADPSLVSLFQTTGRTLLYSATFLFAFITAIFLLLDAQKDSG